MDITFVSTYYPSINNYYLNKFKNFAKSGQPIILFIENTHAEIIKDLSELTNIVLRTDLIYAELPFYKSFPESETVTKENYENFAQINSKVTFLSYAQPDIKTDKVGYIDFINIPEFTNIKNIYIPKNKILIPGLTTEKVDLTESLNTRFCPGVFFCYTNIISKFDELNTDMLKSVYPELTWEVNIWAKIEMKYPNFIQWYKSDQNNGILNFPLNTEKRVIVTLMIKNEERIISRCVQKALAIADAILISDTGSTDKTIEILTTYLPTLPIPAKLVGEQWKNFGINRTLSLKATQKFCEEIGWDLSQTYSLVLDADMNLQTTPNFNKNQLLSNGYRIKQKNPGLEYYNTRFMKLSHPWKCVGVTHEYWDGSETDQLETIYIDDIGDGGCKSDKFIRDEKLLTEGLAEDPTNIRYMFYLAQTLKDLKKLPESIHWYEKRAQAGGWFEEVWYSMYQISRLYFELNKLPEMEFWGLKAYEFNKFRSENLYFLTKVFRERSEHFKAWHYMKLGLAIKKTTDMLFVEPDVYTHLFEYEKTILNYYVFPERQKTSLNELIAYMNKKDTGSWINLQFYVGQIPNKGIRDLNYKQIGDFLPTSISALKQSEHQYILNIRYVNYRIQKDGSYIMSENNILSPNNPVKTRNFRLITDNQFNALSPMEEMIIDFPKKQNVNIQGIEDIRLYNVDNTIKWIGTSMEYSHDGHIKQIYGDYNISDNKLNNGISLKSPTNSECEKNWIPLNNNKFIYKWFPYTVGHLLSDQFITDYVQQTPKIFEHMRGSSNVVLYENNLIAITHVVIYSQPRKYYHVLVKLDPQTYKLTHYTMPFYFKHNHIEYCLGIDIQNKSLNAFVSQNDRDPIIVEIGMENVEFISI